MTEREAMTAALRAYWVALLAQTHGNVTEAAKFAGVHRQTVHLRKVRLGLPRRVNNAGNWKSVDGEAAKL